MAEDFQRSATRIALGAMGGHGFALAGSGALREHGLLTRQSLDIDLFTTMQHGGQFGAALDAGLQALDLARMGQRQPPTPRAARSGMAISGAAAGSYQQRPYHQRPHQQRPRQQPGRDH